MSQRAEEVASFRESVENLARNWLRLKPQKNAPNKKEPKGSRLPRGPKTPEKEFHKTILEILVEMGGEGKTDEVLNKVGERMGAVLKPVDHETLRSGKGARWRNTAQWARNQLKTRGLLKAEVARGIWAITEQGQAHLVLMGINTMTFVALFLAWG